jgi:hypothetical protein
MTGQTSRQSWAEAWVNIGVGYFISLTANMVVLPCFGVSVSLKQSFYASFAFTGLSLVRAYVLRRIFNRWHASVR